MIETTSGFRASQLMASSRSVWPRFSAKACSASIVSKCGVEEAARRVGVTRAFRMGLALAVLAGERAAAQREIRDETKAVLFQRREQRRLVVAEGQAVFVLCADEAFDAESVSPPRRPRRSRRLRNSTRRRGRTLPGLHSSSSARERLLDRRRRIRLVHEEQIDTVRLQALQARLDGGMDIGATAAMIGSGAGHRLAEFCGEHASLRRRVPSTLPMTVSEPPLPAVDVGGVEMGDADIEGRVDDLSRGFKIDAPAEIVRAEADKGKFGGRTAPVCDVPWKDPRRAGLGD